MMHYENSLDFAKDQDTQDDLSKFRKEFHFPLQQNGSPFIYLCGNSLGIKPKGAKDILLKELDQWKDYGVEGYFHGENPWVSYYENLTKMMAKVVGAREEEVVVMNTLSVNLHLMMVSFYRPEGQRVKIMIEKDAFPSDKFAVASHLRLHKIENGLIELSPRVGEDCLRSEDIKSEIEKNKDELALVLIGNTNYYTGQFFDMKSIAEWGHTAGAMVGFDCAHAAGNLPLNLSDTDADFAVWCTYKYMNSGPGSLSGCYVNKRHHGKKDIPRLEGWWGYNKATRFLMQDGFDPIPTAEAWQLSCPPIFSMAPIWESLRLFDQAGIDNLRKKSIRLTGYLEYMVDQIQTDRIKIITPSDPQQRGCQLSLKVNNANKALFEQITEKGVIADWREPDVIRIAPTPLYNSFEDVYGFVKILESCLI